MLDVAAVHKENSSPQERALFRRPVRNVELYQCDVSTMNMRRRVERSGVQCSSGSGGCGFGLLARSNDNCWSGRRDVAGAWLNAAERCHRGSCGGVVGHGRMVGSWSNGELNEFMPISTVMSDTMAGGRRD